MKTLSKLFNNPLSLIVVLASVWYLTRDFIYFTYAILIFISIQVLLEKLALGKVSKVLFFMELTTSVWFVDVIIKRSNLPAMEILNSSLVDGFNFIGFADY